jgi:hypothetical protein
MIAFDLECSQGHIFEGWFNNTQSFEEQNTKKLVSCPYCNDTNIKKVISPVTMKTSSLPEKREDVRPIDYGRLAKEVVEYIDKNFEDLGPGFTTEALKMHYGVAEKRNIKGSATAEEEKTLEDEGIQFFKIPIPKEDDDKNN